MCCPRPERPRSASADWMATVAYSPVRMSTRATPTFCGPAPSSVAARPVMLIRPPMPWMRKS